MEQIVNSLDVREPLVSVIIVTYNSAEFIIETLESIKNQTYENLELIVTDDASKDGTIALCEEWLQINGSRFIHSRLITVETNSRLVNNCNRGLAEVKGDWVKLLAGDDCLAKNAIETLVNYALSNQDCSIIQTPVLKFCKDKNGNKQFDQSFSRSSNILNKNVTAEQQFHLLTKGCPINAPSVFMKKKLVDDIGLFDPEIPNCEDWPYWLRLTKKGYQFHYIDEPLAHYRVREDSIYYEGSKDFYISSFYKTERLVYKKYIRNSISPLRRAVAEYEFFIKDRFSSKKATIFIKIIYKIATMPVILYRKINK